MEAGAALVDENGYNKAMLTATRSVLPRGTRAIYLDEGAANIVYTLEAPHLAMNETVNGAIQPVPNSRYHLGDPITGDSFFDGKLLRLRKDLPYTAPCYVAHADFLRFIAPHFNRKDLVSQCLVHVKPSGLIPRLNEELQLWEREDKIPYSYRGSSHEPIRPRKRRGVYLADDDFGLLVADQRPTKGIAFIEFKPKWLTQSPAAPKLSRRCRTCAKRAYLNAQRARSREPPIEGFCPLNLVSGNEKLIFRAVKSILNLEAQIFPSAPSNLHRLCQWTKHTPLLNRLRDIQQLLDDKGVFAADSMDKNFLTAMTLRDCSVYLRIPNDISQPITAKLGDLDLKTPEKAAYWKRVEAPLLAEGWYLGTEKEEDKQPLDCYLFPEHWTALDKRALSTSVQ